MNIDEVANIMEEILKGLLDEKIYPYPAKRNFGTGNKVATGRLKASIEVIPTSRKGNIVFEVFANDYFQWVQSGRAAGKKPVPLDAILDWMSARGIFATDVGNVKYKALQSQVSAAYMINRKRIKSNKKPLPMRVLIDWIKKENIDFKVDLQRGMAFAIQKNIVKFGINPANIEDKLFERLQSSTEFEDALGQYTFDQFVDMIDKIFISTKKEVI